jgi:hypothetical protein
LKIKLLSSLAKFRRCAVSANATVIQSKASDIVDHEWISCHSCPAYPHDNDAIFSYIEKLQHQFMRYTKHTNESVDSFPSNLKVDDINVSPSPSWGSVLDAGTGSVSLKWITKLNTDRWTAVTASSWMRDTLRSQFKVNIPPFNTESNRSEYVRTTS